MIHILHQKFYTNNFLRLLTDGQKEKRVVLYHSKKQVERDLNVHRCVLVVANETMFTQISLEIGILKHTVRGILKTNQEIFPKEFV